MIEQINALLPQTQCEQCGYKGCKPYAEAMAKGEAATNLCVPGGKPTMQALSALLDQPLPEKLALEKSTLAQKVVINEAECIGCTKCLQVCPTDAIIGGPKHMHTIIADYCTGCELCIPLCPTDCMDVVASEQPAWVVDNPIQAAIAENYKLRHQQRKDRLTIESKQKRDQDMQKQAQRIKLEIQACLERAKNKKHVAIQNQ